VPRPGTRPTPRPRRGVINFTKTAALELATHQIRVNALAPDITPTEGLAQLATEGSDGENAVDREAKTALTVPLGRLGHLDDLAGAAVFLASGLSSYVTGQTIHVDGGTSAAAGYHHPETGGYTYGAP
jgi:3-oxoacyl-[acyl-carrier protein] reductase